VDKWLVKLLYLKLVSRKFVNKTRYSTLQMFTYFTSGKAI